MSILDVPDPSPLPGPSAAVHYTVEQPWPAVFLLILAALIAFSFLHSRAQTQRGAALAGACVGLAGIVFLASMLITTAREAMTRDVRTLVHAVGTSDMTGVDDALDDACMLYYFQAPTGLDKGGILTAVQAAFNAGGAYRVSNVSVEDIQAFTRDRSTGQVQVKVFARPEQTGYPHHSWWRLDMKRHDDGRWRATAIKPLSVQGMENPGG